MDHVGLRNQNRCPACGRETPCPVDLFAVHKVALIEQTDLIDERGKLEAEINGLEAQRKEKAASIEAGSLAAYDKAIELLPGRTAYWVRKAGLLTNVQPETALDAYDGAIKADPSNSAALRSAGALAEAEGQLERARSYFTRAVEVDPYNPGTVTAAATFELRHGGAIAAKELLETAVARTPGQAALWTPLGDARQVLGDLPGAIEAYERAVSLDPAQTKAATELEKLQQTP